MKRDKLRVVRGDDKLWVIEGDERIDVLRGPYRTRDLARSALRTAKANQGAGASEVTS